MDLKIKFLDLKINICAFNTGAAKLILGMSQIHRCYRRTIHILGKWKPTVRLLHCTTGSMHTPPLVPSCLTRCYALPLLQKHGLFIDVLRHKRCKFYPVRSRIRRYFHHRVCACKMEAHRYHHLMCKGERLISHTSSPTSAVCSEWYVHREHF